MRVPKTLIRAGRAASRAGVVTSALDVLGAATVTYGAGLIYRPAWFIVGGAFALVMSWAMTPAPPKTEGGAQ